MNIHIHNLKKTFGNKTAVNVPECLVKSGEILGLVGNNGAGKTTLFRLILDLIKADDGYIELEQIATEKSGIPTGHLLACNPAESEEWKLFTGAYVDEGFLIDFLTPEEYFEFIAKINNIEKNTFEKRLKTLEPLMAGEVLGQKKYIRNFSAGNKQKIGIISALINQPQLLILDEPFNFLDPTSQHILKRTLTEYNQQTGATVLISSHNLQHTVDISTRIALLEHGRIVEDLPNEGGNATQVLEEYFAV